MMAVDVNMNIGLSRTKADDWTWVNGQPLTWTNWGWRQPSGGNRKCVQMEASGFYDVPCDVTRGVTACQMPMGMSGCVIFSVQRL